MAAPASAQSQKRTFIIGSRASKLAQVQTYSIKATLSQAFPDESFDVAFMLTGGDKNKVDPLYLFGQAGKALWTEELEAALLKERTIDFIVHSLKDMPTTLPEGAELGAIVERHDPLDSLVVKTGLSYKTLEDLPDGSVVGTSSVRRVAQLRRAFPRLVFSDMRGNIDTRLAKLDAEDSIFSAIILAHAGLERMNFTHRITSDIVPPHLYHAVGQGALGIEIRSDDVEARRLLEALRHVPSEMRCRAERSCLRVLEGGCSVPVGVETLFVEASSSNSEANSPNGTLTESSPSSSPSSVQTRIDQQSTLTLTGSVTSLDGASQVVFTSPATPMLSFADAETLGETVARELIERGARAILDEVNKERAIRDAALKEKKKSKADKGLALPTSINGVAAAAAVPKEADAEAVIESATTVPEQPTVPVEELVSAIAFLPPGHPPIPGSPRAALSAHPPHPHVPTVEVPSATIDDATPILPASHPPILVTPSKDAHAALPLHCLRPATPPPNPMAGVSAEEAKRALEEGRCLRPGVESALEGLKRKAVELDDEETPEDSETSPKRRALERSGRRREMMG
ncbi:hypothetical protein DL93DRAFT_2071073 [Clavulina sp. PMI_390]|nr:hypothetical protein DL93DRAFT_2071073 [Clavulina sp. PMI_390]